MIRRGIRDNRHLYRWKHGSTVHIRNRKPQALLAIFNLFEAKLQGNAPMRVRDGCLLRGKCVENSNHAKLAGIVGCEITNSEQFNFHGG